MLKRLCSECLRYVCLPLRCLLVWITSAAASVHCSSFHHPKRVVTISQRNLLHDYVCTVSSLNNAAAEMCVNNNNNNNNSTSKKLCVMSRNNKWKMTIKTIVVGGLVWVHSRLQTALLGGRSVGVVNWTLVASNNERRRLIINMFGKRQYEAKHMSSTDRPTPVNPLPKIYHCSQQHQLHLL